MHSPDFDLCLIMSIIACLILHRYITQARDQFWLLVITATAMGFAMTALMEVPSSLSIPAYSAFIVMVLIASRVYEWQIASMQPSTTLRLAYVVDVGLVSGILMWFIIR